MELCRHFATSRDRVNILLGFVNFRIQLSTFGVQQGVQWIDGSFIENIEASANRSPGDIDVLTIYYNLPIPVQQQIFTSFPEWGNPQLAKANYRVDHYSLDIGWDPMHTVEMTRYWFQLFTHNRNTIWKGIIALPLGTLNDDQQALAYLNGLTI